MFMGTGPFRNSDSQVKNSFPPWACYTFIEEAVMAIIPRLVCAALVLGVAAGCEQTIEPEGQADRSTDQLPLDLTPSGSNSALGGAIRAADRTEDRISAHQDRLNKMMEEE
jgi:hypothetical protein